MVSRDDATETDATEMASIGDVERSHAANSRTATQERAGAIRLKQEGMS